jgi:alkylated DNA repair dioxygenase AlkB
MRIVLFVVLLCGIKASAFAFLRRYSPMSTLKRKFDFTSFQYQRADSVVVDLTSETSEGEEPVIKEQKIQKAFPLFNSRPKESSSLEKDSQKKMTAVRNIANDLLNLKSFPCKTPSFRNQIVLNRPGITPLDDVNTIAIKYDFLPAAVLQEYLEEASRVLRYSGKSAFNSIKPRREVCYTIDGQAFRYSRISHQTTKYPPHVLKLMPFFNNAIQEFYPQNRFKELSGGLDIIYSPEFERGGSAGRHRDSEMKWGLVLIFSLGQTRWFRIRQYEENSPQPTPQYYNIEMKHNSVIMMHGKTFQQLYTHQVDKLSKEEEVYYRLSLNIRYLEGEDNIPQLMREANLS